MAPVAPHVDADIVVLAVRNGLCARAALIRRFQASQDELLRVIDAPLPTPENVLWLLPNAVYSTSSTSGAIVGQELRCATYGDAFTIDSVLLAPSQDHLAAEIMDIGFAVRRKPS